MHESTQGLASMTAAKQANPPKNRVCAMCGEDFTVRPSPRGSISSRKICYEPDCEIKRDKIRHDKNNANRRKRDAERRAKS